jgi:hypothetical protein
MSARREEGPAGTLAALHNCGPGTREIFVTSPVGHVARFDLAAARAGWMAAGHPAGAGGEAPCRSAPHAVPMAAVLSAIDAALKPRAAARHAAEARRLLAVLIETLRAEGALDDLHGIARAETRGPFGPMKPPPPVSALELARTLAVHAVFAPPLLLWSRSPSLRWMPSKHLLTLRRFDCPAAGSES